MIKKLIGTSILLVGIIVCPVIAQEARPSSEGKALIAAYLKAQKNDPQFRAAMAEHDANMIYSKIAGSAYYPQLSLSNSQLANENGDQRHTASIIQPIISADKYATLQEKEPRAGIAEATFQLRHYELASRIYKVFSNLTLAREGLEQNRAKMDALQHQYNAGKRTFELGQGTVTDMTDAKVKMLQAKANDLKLKNELQAAKDEYLSMVGEMPPELRLNKQLSPTSATEEFTPEHWVDRNNNVILAKLHAQLGELDVTRAKSTWIPEVSASYTYTSTEGESETFLGISMSMPISAGKFYSTRSASANMTKLQEESIDKQRQAKLEIQRLTSTIQAGLAELVTRREAIEAAKLSVTSNEQSYKGGVRSLLDVLASIDVLYAIQGEYVTAALTLGENLLNLRIQQGQDIIKGLSDIERLILPSNEHAIDTF